jgi:hypothetical protein
MHARRAVLDVYGDVVRVAHWAHTIRPERCARFDHARRMTEWHRRWQSECSDAARVEVAVERAGRRRVADVVTPFGWALEFQHSRIGASVYQARTDHYQGRVAWVFDTSEAAGGSLERHGNLLVWLDQRAAKNHRHPYRDGLLFLDAGPGLWLLPPDGSATWTDATGSRFARMNACAWWSRERFVSRWINGDVLPLAEPVLTPWAAARAAADPAARRRGSIEGPAAAAPRHQDRPTPCGYSGDRRQLVGATALPAAVAPLGTADPWAPVPTAAPDATAPGRAAEAEAPVARLDPWAATRSCADCGAGIPSGHVRCRDCRAAMYRPRVTPDPALPLGVKL